jgi:hypothetical protein
LWSPCEDLRLADQIRLASESHYAEVRRGFSDSSASAHVRRAIAVGDGVGVGWHVAGGGRDRDHVGVREGGQGADVRELAGRTSKSEQPSQPPDKMTDLKSQNM